MSKEIKKAGLLEIRQTAAEVLAAAVLELCPDAHIIEGRGTSTGFVYYFHFPSSFAEEMLPFIEERMRNIIKQDLPITHREMIPENASQFFQHYPRYYPSIFAKQRQEPFVDVFEMRGFVDLCLGPFAQSTGELGFIKLIGISKRPPIHYRGKERPVIGIEGIVSNDQESLKEFLQGKKESFKMKHLNQGKRLGLFVIQEERGKHHHEVHRCFWLSKGRKLKETLSLFWRKVHEAEGYEVIQTQGNNLLKNHEALLRLRRKELKGQVWKTGELSRELSQEGIDPWEGLYDSKDYYFDRAHIFCLKDALKKELISSLHFLEKTSKMFSFNSAYEIFIPKKDKELHVYLKEACEANGIEAIKRQGKLPKVLWRITDRYGRKRSGSFIELRKREKQFIISHSLFNQMERFIALLMEAEGSSFEERMKDIAKKRSFN